MTDALPLFVLPELDDERANEAFQAHAVDLAEALVDVVGNDTIARIVSREAVKPTAESIGAALYLALRAIQLQYPPDDPRYNGVRAGFFSAFVLNDEDWKMVEVEEFFRSNKHEGSA